MGKTSTTKTFTAVFLPNELFAEMWYPQLWKTQKGVSFFCTINPWILVELQQQKASGPDKWLLFFVAKSKTLLEVENFNNEKTGPSVVFSRFLYVTESNSKFLFTHSFFCAILDGSTKAITLLVLAIFTCACKITMVSSPLIRTETNFFY